MKYTSQESNLEAISKEIANDFDNLLKEDKQMKKSKTYLIVGKLYSSTISKDIYEVVSMLTTENEKYGTAFMKSRLEDFKNSRDWPGYTFSLFVKME
jgi:hypothetical protein